MLEARVRVDRDDLRAGGGVPGGGLTEVLDFSLRGRLQAPCVGTGLAFLALLLPFGQEGRVPAQREEREQPRATMWSRGRPIRWAPMPVDPAAMRRAFACGDKRGMNLLSCTALTHQAHTIVDNNIFR